MRKRTPYDEEIQINYEEDDDFGLGKKNPRLKRTIVAISIGIVVFYLIAPLFISLFEVKQSVEEVVDSSTNSPQFGYIEYNTGAIDELTEYEISVSRGLECNHKILELRDKTLNPTQTLKYTNPLINDIPFDKIVSQSPEIPKEMYNMIQKEKINLKEMYPNFYKITTYYHNNGAYIQMDFDEDGIDYRKFYVGVQSISETTEEDGIDTAIISYEYSITSAYENFYTDTVVKDIQSIFGDLDDEEAFIATIPEVISTINDIENNKLECAASFMTSSGATITIYGEVDEEADELTVSIIGTYLKPCTTTSATTNP